MFLVGFAQSIKFRDGSFAGVVNETSMNVGMLMVDHNCRILGAASVIVATSDPCGHLFIATGVPVQCWLVGRRGDKLDNALS